MFIEPVFALALLVASVGLFVVGRRRNATWMIVLGGLGLGLLALVVISVALLTMMFASEVYR